MHVDRIVLREADRQKGWPRGGEKPAGIWCTALTKLKNVLQKSNSAAARGDNPLYLNNNGGQ